jgi:hypothetical protein
MSLPKAEAVHAINSIKESMSWYSSKRRLNRHTQEVQHGRMSSYKLMKMLYYIFMLFMAYSIYYSCISNICASITSNSGADINIFQKKSWNRHTQEVKYGRMSSYT